MASSGSFRGSGSGGSFTFPITGKVSGRSVRLKTGPYKQDPTYSATFTGKLSKTGKMMSGKWKATTGQTGRWSSKLKPRPRNTIKVRGPTSNTYHKNFNETVSGFATGAANYVISGEQLYPHGGCAKTYTAEKGRSDWYQWPTGTGAVKGKFSLVANFYARNHKTHGICSYLINSGTLKTYAHASRFWHNS